MPLFSNAAVLCLAISGLSVAVEPITYTHSPGQYFEKGSPILDTIEIKDDFAICDLDLRVDILHYYTDDIDISLKLTNPETITTTTLVEDRCGSSNDLILTFDDSSPHKLPDGRGNGKICDVNGITVAPQDSLAIYNGKSSKGTWTLDLVDDFAGDSGTLVSWSLIMTPCCAGESGGGCMGDPHFKTWSGDWFDFHGMCDLVLLDHPTYDGGAGLSIDIRTKSRYQYSFIERVALKIGDDILEIGAWGSWIMNGISQGELSMLDNYPVAYEMKSEKEHKFRVELEEGAIVIVSFNDLLSVNIEDHTYKVFGGSQGMMGQYGTGKMLGRNGTTITDPDEFGNEWQVRDTEVLFQVANLPSSHCVMPSPQNAEIRRLGESIGVDAAEKACAHWGNNKDLCVFDVLAMNDFEVAEHPMAGAF